MGKSTINGYVQLRYVKLSEASRIYHLLNYHKPGGIEDCETILVYNLAILKGKLSKGIA
jgi:hypothetical protein